jgi:glutathione S-transferase
MKLYYAKGTCSLAPHIVIREADLDILLERVDLKTHTTLTQRDYLIINPMGAVPALELDNGELLTENAVLLQYLASLAPTSEVALPAEGMERWRLLELLNFIATELHKGFSQLFAHPPEEWRQKAVEKIKSRFALLVTKLGAKPYLTGDRFSIADAYVFVMLTWAPRFEIDLPAELQVYERRIRARPAVQGALREEGLPTS